LIVGILAVVVGYASLKHYLRSDAFRRLLSTAASEAIGMRGEFGLFRWDGLVAETPTFKADGDGLLSAVDAGRLRAEVVLASFRRGAWELEGASVGHLEINLDARNRNLPPDPEQVRPAPAAPPARQRKGWLPTAVKLRNLDLRDVLVKVMLDSGQVRADGLRVRLQQGDRAGTYTGELVDGAVRLPFPLVPRVENCRADFRVNAGEVFATNVSGRVFMDGRMKAAGEWDWHGGTYAFEGEARDVKCAEFLNETWAKRLTGDAATTFLIEGSGTAPVASGTLVIDRGVLTALPVLDTLAAYADSRRFRTLILSEARTDWRWQPGQAKFTNLVLASDGLIRLEGWLEVRGKQLDGRFRLGLAPGTLASIPGAETVVFAPGERGLLWSTLAISGTTDAPEEDLTARLVAAAGARLFEIIPETGERVLKFTRSILEDTQPLQQGVEILGDTADEVLRRGTGLGTGLIDGILGGSRRPPPPPPEPKNGDAPQNDGN
jgi:hypothetical protein